MTYKLHHWQTTSEDASWCASGMSLLNMDNPQKAMQIIQRELQERKGVDSIPPVKLFIMPSLTKEIKYTQST